MIVVTSNYRLSGLGFAALPELANVTGNGNFGLLDQRLALQWVQDNIAAFGGDRSRVTIWGQSAGGQSVCFHLASPASAGLFSAAISSSGPCILPYPLVLSAQQEGVKWGRTCWMPECRFSAATMPSERLLAQPVGGRCSPQLQMGRVFVSR